MAKKYWIISIAVLFILSSLLTACGGGNTATSTGNTLVYGRGADSISLDPSQATDGESHKVSKEVFDTLVEYKKETTEVQPGLAESWETSSDGKTWTFHLRKGVKFQDGTDFNADAVAFNFNRWMDPKDPTHKGGDFSYYSYMFGGFKGDAGHVIKAVTAVDPNTVKFELNKPQGPFLNNLAMESFGIASPTAVKKDPVAFNQHPVGTGPFTFVSWKKNDSIVLEKNKDYWQAGKPKLDKIIFRSIPDNAARFTALQSGDIDIMDGMNPDDAAVVKGNSNLQLFEQQGMNVAYLAFNTTKKPFDNVKVRQAINYAVNKQAIIKNFYAGMAEPAINPIPKVMWGYNDQVKDYEFNLAKAKELLKEAGYPDGLTIDFYAMQDPRPYMPNGKKIAEYVQQDLAKIGVKTNIISYEWSTYKERVENGEAQMAFFGWIGDNGDPDNFLYVLLDKDNTRTPGAGNIAFYKNNQLHDILIQAQALTDQKQRTELYKQAQTIIKADAPWVPLVHATVPLAAKKDVTGFFPHPTGIYDLREVSFQN